MENQTAAAQAAPPTWFWIASALGLIWNVIGVMAFIGQVTADLTTFTAAERDFYESTPLWATAAFAIAVFSGSIGCLALLLRKSWAFLMLTLCLIAILIQVSHSLLLSNGLEVFGPEGLVLPILTIVIGALLAWFARYAGAQGWLAGAG